MFLNLEGFFYVLFSGSYLSAHTKQNLSIHSISENGRKPVKKISASATVLLTLKVEVQSPYNRITISYNRKGHRAFAVFLLSIFVGKCHRLLVVLGVVRHLSIWILNISKIQMGGTYSEIRTEKGIYQGKRQIVWNCPIRISAAAGNPTRTYMDKLFIPIQGCTECEMSATGSIMI